MDKRNDNQQQPEERSPQDLAVKNPEQWTTGQEQRTSAERGTQEQPRGTEQADRNQETEGEENY